MQSTVHQTEVLPFSLGLLFGWISHPYLAAQINLLGYALFTGTAFSITALPILGRGLMELVVINVGLDLRVSPPPVFTMLVIMAIASTVVTTPALKVWLNLTRRANPQGLRQPQAAPLVSIAGHSRIRPCQRNVTRNAHPDSRSKSRL